MHLHRNLKGFWKFLWGVKIGYLSVRLEGFPELLKV